MIRERLLLPIWPLQELAGQRAWTGKNLKASRGCSVANKGAVALMQSFSFRVHCPRVHSTTDVIMVGSWMLSSRNTSDHGRYHGCFRDALLSERWTSSWLGHGCSVLRMHQAIAAITVGPWMLASQNALDHGRDHGWAMDALFLERIRAWTISWLVHGCSRVTTAVDHGRHHGLLMDAVCSAPDVIIPPTPPHPTPPTPASPTRTPET